MISFSEAKVIVRTSVSELPAQVVSLREAAGLVLAEDIYAETDIPPFDQSAMDGYAFAFRNGKQGVKLPVSGVVPAGYPNRFAPPAGTAVRIFTGAPIPEGTDTVVMQEKVRLEKGTLLLEDAGLRQGGNVRPRGSELRAGTLALRKGALLSPAAIGFLASIGRGLVPVIPKPSVTLLITGNELGTPGCPLSAGQVYECNSFALEAALRSLQISRVTTRFVPDDPLAMKAALRLSLQESGLVLITGGISAGDYDFVRPAARACGVEELFYKVRQKPGKPLYFGKKEDTVVFALPGNPAPVLTCFYEYVLEALALMSGSGSVPETVCLPLAQPFSKKEGMTQLLKGRSSPERVYPLGAQESYRLSSFAGANCLILLEESRTHYEAEEPVEVHLLPF